METPGGSVLLHELASAPNLETAFTSDTATPLLHAMNAAHGYVVMFVHVCRTSQSEIRNLSMNHWGSELGLAVLKGLSELYMSLVWESTLLLALCSEDTIPAGCDFGKEDMDKLVPPELKVCIVLFINCMEVDLILHTEFIPSNTFILFFFVYRQNFDFHSPYLDYMT